VKVFERIQEKIFEDSERTYKDYSQHSLRDVTTEISKEF